MAVGMSQVSLDELKRLLVENCVLKVDLNQIGEDTPLFGPNSVGLDSLDALQMTVAIEQNYGRAIPDSNVARQVLRTLGSLRDWLAQPPAN
jgi:acyl carrier protein